MKRFVSIYPASLLILCSLLACTKEITDIRNDIPDKLIVNAQMALDDSVHCVYLGLSERLRIGTLSGGSVRCFIGDSLVAEGVRDDGDDDRYLDSYIYSSNFLLPTEEAQQLRFSFKADFKAGDEVRIETSGISGEDSYSTVSQVTVPSTPTFELVDTTHYSSNIRVRGIKIKGSDPAGEKNWYRLEAKRYTLMDYYVGDSEEGPFENNPVYSKECPTIDFGNDPILNEGLNLGDLELPGSGENRYYVFSDNLFDGQDFSISFNLVSDFWSYFDEEYLESHNYVRLEMSVDYTLTLYSITQQEYNYLRALDVYEETSYFLSMFFEPVSFGSNVEGGIGVVSISNGSSVEIKERETIVYRNGVRQ